LIAQWEKVADFQFWLMIQGKWAYFCRAGNPWFRCEFRFTPQGALPVETAQS